MKKKAPSSQSLSVQLSASKKVPTQIDPNDPSSAVAGEEEGQHHT